MPDNPSKLQHIQLPTEPSDGLATGIMEANSSAGWAIDCGTVTGAAKENVERRPCDCENARLFGMPFPAYCAIKCFSGSKLPENVYCAGGKRHLP